MNKITTSTLAILTTALMLPGVTLAETSTGSTAMVAGTNVAQSGVQQLTLQEAKTTLVEMIDRLDAHFQQTKDKTASLQKIAELSGIDIAQLMQDYCAQIHELKDKAQNAQTAAELKDVATKVHNLIMDAKLDVKKNISQRVETRIDQFTKKTANIQTIFSMAEKRLNQLKNQGKDVEDVSKAFDDCQNLMKEGDEILQNAKEKFQEFQDLEKSDQGALLMSEGLKFLKEARLTYGQAQQDCSKVMKQLRGLR